VLYHFSVITAFRYWHGADLVEGILKPKQTGRDEFEKAIRQDTVGSLLEQHTSEVFETAIGNIQPNHDVKIEIHYVTELKADLSGHGLVLTIPSSVAPRYGTPPASISGNLNSSSRTHIDGGIKIEVNVTMPVSVRSLKCRAHPVEVEMGYNDLKTSTSFFRDLNRPPTALKYDATKAKARSTIQETTLKADYVLVIITSPSEHSDIPGLLAPRALMETALPVRGLIALQVAFTPRDLFPLRDEPPRINSEIVLLVDLSGSMVLKMESLQRALALFLRNLHADSLFNICVFGTNFESMWNQSKPINPQNSADAEGYISQLKANKGRTNLRNALQKAANRTRQHFATQVVVFTDGELWDVEGVHNYVRQAKDTYGDALRFFALGIGDNVSHELVEGIGKFGGGFAEVVPVDSSEQWNDRIERMLNGVRTCSDWKINLKLKDTDGNLHSRSGFSMQKDKDMGNSGRFIQAPHYLPVVHGFSRTTVYLLIDAYPAHYTAAKVEAIANDGQEFSTEIEFEHVSADKPVFHQFAARALLYDIEMGYSWLHDRELISSKRTLGSTTPQHIDEEAEHIAMLWNLVSKWTSFVGIHGVDQSPRQSAMHRFGPSRRNQNQRELKELMKPRKGGPVFHSGRHGPKDEDDDPPPPGGGGSAGGTAGGSAGGSTGTSSGGAIKGRGTTSEGGSNGGGTEHSSNYGSSRAAGDMHDSAGQTASIEQLAALQDQDGAFPSVEAESNERLNVLEIVLRFFNPDVLEMLEWRISGVDATESQRSQICKTFICIVFLKRMTPPSIQRTRILKRAEVFLSRCIKKRSQRSSIENDVGRSWMMGRGAFVSLMNAAEITSESSVVSADAMEDVTYIGEPDSSLSQDAIDSDSYVSSEVPGDTQFWRSVPGSTSLQESDHNEEAALRTHNLVEEVCISMQEHMFLITNSCRYLKLSNIRQHRWPHNLKASPAPRSLIESVESMTAPLHTDGKEGHTLHRWHTLPILILHTVGTSNPRSLAKIRIPRLSHKADHRHIPIHLGQVMTYIDEHRSKRKQHR
jgi:Mg-chelatase subunit ChlD